MMMLPISIPGARIIARSNKATISRTWVTSLVRRVINCPVSNSSRLPKESDCVLRNRALRRSAPNACVLSSVNTLAADPSRDADQGIANHQQTCIDDNSHI